VGLQGETRAFHTVQIDGAPHRLSVQVENGVARLVTCSTCTQPLLNLIDDVLASGVASAASRAQLEDLAREIRAILAAQAGMTQSALRTRLEALGSRMVGYARVNRELAPLLDFAGDLVPGKRVRYFDVHVDANGVLRRRPVNGHTFEATMRDVVSRGEGVHQFPMPHNGRQPLPRMKKVVDPRDVDTHQGFDFISFDHGQPPQMWIGESKYSEHVASKVQLNKVRGGEGLQLDALSRQRSAAIFSRGEGALARLRDLYDDPTGHIFDLQRRFDADFANARYAVIAPKHVDVSRLRDDMRAVGLNPERDLFIVDLQRIRSDR
jgi:hypothetical protein